MQANHSVSRFYEASVAEKPNGPLKQSKFNNQTHFQKTLSQTEEEIEDEDLMVDLNTGSLTPVSLKYWTRMSNMTEEFDKL
ncbi:YKL068W-A [Saccharomyces arboricola H-6]|uniref:YKL068W-A n=1 Tax=Saccharomyces arboricola (strain H-6 / AS 2.3317 / CBS 10644) TaxID=1160507 RepID=J8Q2Q5_SACAR|nr:YKL068W-A [Saccharomyces arboricola H-6]